MKDPASTDQNKERQVMEVMRKVLTSIIREVTPPPGMKHPLSEQTVEDVRMCLGLITARERELAEEAGEEQMYPRYTDQASQSSVVSLDSLKRGKRDDES